MVWCVCVCVRACVRAYVRAPCLVVSCRVVWSRRTAVVVVVVVVVLYVCNGRGFTQPHSPVSTCVSAICKSTVARGV
jgi:hypothetical protein